MSTTLFLHSQTADPYPLYHRRLAESPVYWDDDQKIWAVYSYRHCHAILTNPAALIPSLPDAGLPDNILAIRNRLVRLSNPPDHDIARQITAGLFRQMRSVPIAPLLDRSLANHSPGESFDWVDSVCRRLPVSYILSSLGFTVEDEDFILTRMPLLLQIMQPVIPGDRQAAVFKNCIEVYERMEQHWASRDTWPGGMLAYTISNLLGLLIQSYDAGRGILTNALLRLIHEGDVHEVDVIHEGDGHHPMINNPSYLTKFVTEVLRYDPPVHNTRRIAGRDFYLDGQLIRQGQPILIVLAAANRDENKFASPATFDIHRSNNHDLLTFGYGPHTCLAATFSIRMATDILSHLTHSYKDIRLEERQLEFEPLINVRLLRRMAITLS
jgi:cytochrome P450